MVNVQEKEENDYHESSFLEEGHDQGEVHGKGMGFEDARCVHLGGR